MLPAEVLRSDNSPQAMDSPMPSPPQASLSPTPRDQDERRDTMDSAMSRLSVPPPASPVAGARWIDTEPMVLTTVAAHFDPTEPVELSPH